MEFIVCKFGGTSVATDEKLKTIVSILNEDDRRKCVVLSAPGKAPGINVKVTDLLISLVKKALINESFEKELNAIKSRYVDIFTPLGLKEDTITEAMSTLDQRTKCEKNNAAKYRDAVVACGEEIHARLFAEYLQSINKNALFVSPQEIKLVVTSEFGDAQPLEESRNNLCRLKEMCRDKIIVFPGFYGITKNNDIATFSRGGSDLTGAILAEAIDALEYENWTDVDGIFSANPNIVPSPAQIPALTYKEMRELSYMGFNVLHEEAVKPVLKKKIPIRLRNINNIANTGTLIVTERLPSERDIIGIACGGKFCNFNLQKFLLNREVGFGRRLLAIFEEMNLSYEHCPSGIDNISVILDQDQLRPETVNNVLRSIEERLKPDEIKTEFGIALIAVVGEGVMHKVGVLAQAASALARANINIKIVNQGSSEISVIFGIDSVDKDKAVAALYNAFFNP